MLPTPEQASPADRRRGGGIGEAGIGEAGIGEAGIGEAGIGEAGIGEAGIGEAAPASLVAAAARPCRYAGAMLLWPFLDVVGFEEVFAGVRGAPARHYDDMAVLGSGLLGFALGASSLEGVKRLGRADLGALVGRAMAPELHTLRPGWGPSPMPATRAVQTALARGLRASDEAPSQVFFVDDHFVPYSGARLVAKGSGRPTAPARPRAGPTPTSLTWGDGRCASPRPSPPG